MIYNKLTTSLQTDEGHVVCVVPNGRDGIEIQFGDVEDNPEYLCLKREDWAKLCHAVSLAFDDADGELEYQE